MICSDENRVRNGVSDKTGQNYRPSIFIYYKQKHNYVCAYNFVDNFDPHVNYSQVIHKRNYINYLCEIGLYTQATQNL